MTKIIIDEVTDLGGTVSLGYVVLQPQYLTEALLQLLEANAALSRDE